jgi:hypothetical protein
MFKIKHASCVEMRYDEMIFDSIVLTESNRFMNVQII